MDLKQRFGYDKDGQDIDPDNFMCMAKKVITENGNEKYFIKHFTTGMNRNSLVNPHASTFSVKLMKQGEGIADFVAFQTVTKTSFDLYLKFLETKNELWYNKAIYSFGE